MTWRWCYFTSKTSSTIVFHDVLAPTCTQHPLSHQYQNLVVKHQCYLIKYSCSIHPAHLPASKNLDSPPRKVLFSCPISTLGTTRGSSSTYDSSCLMEYDSLIIPPHLPRRRARNCRCCSNLHDSWPVPLSSYSPKWQNGKIPIIHFSTNLAGRVWIAEAWR